MMLRPGKGEIMGESLGGMVVSDHDRSMHKSHHRILGLTVNGGFLDGARLEFSDGLNCIIGGRGTGKTTVLEFIRYILGMLPDTNDARPRVKATESHVRNNLGSGMVSLEVETKHGTRYRTERLWGDDVHVLDSDGNPVAVSLDRDLVFKADIYSQNEIEEIATNPKSQLALIDKFAEEPIRAINAEIQKSRRAIEQNSLELRSLDLRIREIQEVVPELEIVSKRLKEMQAVAGSDADLINRAHEHKALRAREAEAIKELRDLASSTAARFSRFASSVAESFANASDDDCRTGPNGTLFADIKIAVDEFAAVFTDAAPKIQSRSETLVLRLDEAARHLAEAHARQEQQYREIIAHSEKERRMRQNGADCSNGTSN